MLLNQRNLHRVGRRLLTLPEVDRSLDTNGCVFVQWPIEDDANTFAACQ